MPHLSRVGGTAAQVPVVALEAQGGTDCHVMVNPHGAGGPQHRPIHRPEC